MTAAPTRGKTCVFVYPALTCGRARPVGFSVLSESEFLRAELSGHGQGCCGVRMINSWASIKAGAKLEPYQYEAPPLGPFGVELRVKYCGLYGARSPTVPRETLVRTIEHLCDRSPRFRLPYGTACRPLTRYIRRWRRRLGRAPPERGLYEPGHSRGSRATS